MRTVNSNFNIFYLVIILLTQNQEKRKALQRKCHVLIWVSATTFSEATKENRGHAVAQLDEVLCYKLEGRGFDWNFSLTSSFRPHYGPGVDKTSYKNEYQEYFLGKRRPVRMADNLITFLCRLSWNLGASNSWNPQDLSRPVMDCFTFDKENQDRPQSR
jgi:hypothetical protein